MQSYVPGQKIVLVPNPYWGATTGSNTTATSWSLDPIHHRYVAEISIDETLGSDAAADEVQQEIQAGTLDLEWNTTVPASSLPNLANYTNPLFGSFPSPGITNPYLVFNLQAATPLQNVKVRQALEYAINKVALAKIYGGTDFNVPLNQVFGPGAQGYIAGYDPYPTPNNEGDAAKCKSMLKAAGYANGFTITDYYRTDGNHPAIFEEVQKDFGACGVTVNGKGISQGYYTSSGILQTSASALASSGMGHHRAGLGPRLVRPGQRPVDPPRPLRELGLPGHQLGRLQQLDRRQPDHQGGDRDHPGRGHQLLAAGQQGGHGAGPLHPLHGPAHQPDARLDRPQRPLQPLLGAVQPR